MRPVLTALLLSLPVAAAPVPPAPRELTAEALAARWEYRWGDLRGHLWLHADGTFAGRLHPDGPVYFGSWWIERGAVLVLRENAFYPGTGSVSGPSEYRIPFAPRTYPHLAGECGGSRVELSNPVR